MARNLRLDRLCQALTRDRYVLRRFREERLQAVRLYLGAHWSDEAGSERQPVNLISLYCQIVGRGLIAKDPRVMLSTWDESIRPQVSAMEGWLNDEIRDMQFADTMGRVVLDALFAVGIAKVALATPEDAAVRHWNLKAGYPFIEPVSLDDWVYDVHARDKSQWSYCGHRFRVPMDAIRDDPRFSPERKNLAPSHDQPYNIEGDEKVSALTRMPYAVDSDEYEEWVDLWELYLPRERRIIVLHDDWLSGASLGSDAAPLLEKPWLGPDCGPYHILGYMSVPDNAMPKGPLQDLVDLHLAVNDAYRKLHRQTARQKELTLVAGGAMEDGSRIQQASDGDIVRNDNPERAKIVAFGGPNHQLLEAAVHYTDVYMRQAGNLEMLGGLAPQSKTLGQDELLAGNASGGLQDMQQRTVGFTAQVLRSMAWYWWHHPTLTMQSRYEMPGLPGMGITRHLGPQQRSVLPWSQVKLEVDPYSFTYKTPQQRAQALTQVVQNVLLPMLPILQQQNLGFDVEQFLRLLAQYQDEPDLFKIINMQPAPVQDEQSGAQPEEPGMPAQTTRNYNRRSLGGETPQNRLATMLNGLSANGQQNKNGAAPQGGGTIR